MIGREMRYHKEFEHWFETPEGEHLFLRPIRPTDKELLVAGMQRYSRESIFRRFMTQKQSLTDDELTYLTETDGVNHIALGVGHRITRDDQDCIEGVAVGRCVRLVSQPNTADFALFVGDPWQKKGVGTLLLIHLGAAAREQGISEFTGEMLTRNLPMQRLVKSAAPNARWYVRGEITEVEIDLSDLPEP
ncbi:MAG: hypothetical protein KF812_07745 [Fimbriimonadaceae bacterium]|nr:hypothetical protein [Fimbriimonadaceae bacterium]